MSVNLPEALVPFGIEADIDLDDVITDVVIVAKVHHPDGSTSLQISSSNVDWVAQFGLIAAAWHILRSNPPERSG